ncbi:MAG TPA: sugar phosphate isomerase/epimerase [Terriglobia bacterium]|nr:sugar phosphate isomerase/epimerase [Terriglobia bacterium]
MVPNYLTRREFLGRTGTAAALAVANPGAWGKVATSPVRPLRLGGPIFLKSDDPAELAQEHRRLGYRAAYAPQVGVNDSDRIKAIIKEFAARDVALAEVGAWRNMLDPEPERRRQNLAYVQERLALAELLGARCCVDIAGSYNPQLWDGPDPKNITDEFIDATVENCRHVIDAVKPTRTKFTIEMMPFSFPTGPDDYLRLIKSVDRPAFAVHLDVCNVMNCPERMYNNGAVIDECFRKLGPWIVSCHAKDLAWEPYVQVSLREVIPGRGQIDYRAYLRGLSGLPVDAPLMLEHLKTADEYDEGRHYIQKVAADMGLSLGAEGA